MYYSFTIPTLLKQILLFTMIINFLDQFVFNNSRSVFVRITLVKYEYLLWHYAPEDNSNHFGIILCEVCQPENI